MATLVIDYGLPGGPLELDVDYSNAIGVRKTNAFGNAIDSWHSLVAAKSVTLKLAKGETLDARPHFDGASLT